MKKLLLKTAIPARLLLFALLLLCAKGFAQYSSPTLIDFTSFTHAPSYTIGPIKISPIDRMERIVSTDILVGNSYYYAGANPPMQGEYLDINFFGEGEYEGLQIDISNNLITNMSFAIGAADSAGYAKAYDANGNLIQNITIVNTPGASSANFTIGNGTTPIKKVIIMTALYDWVHFDNLSYTSSSTPSADDTDGDGIPDINDVDDDNDGILDTIELSCTKPELVQNGTFVNGSTNWTSSYVTSPATGGIIFNSGSTGNMIVNVDNDGNLNTANKLMIKNTAGINFISDREYIYSVDLKINYIGISQPDFSVVLVNSSNNVVATLDRFKTNTSATYTGTLITTTSTTYSKILTGLASGTYYVGVLWDGNSNGGDDDIVFDNFSLKMNFCDTDGDGISNDKDLDSDNDGCLDAIEGGANISLSQLVNAGGIASVGTGSSASNQNLCASSSCVSSSGANIGLPQFATLPTGYSNTTGQTIGDSQNAAANTQCITSCYKPATTSGTTLDTKHGITALGRAGADNSNWPMVRKGAWTALEAKTKGFVINRLTDAQIAGIPAANIREGMMVYNITQDCLQINTDGTATGWKCYNTQTCPN